MTDETIHKSLQSRNRIATASALVAHRRRPIETRVDQTGNDDAECGVALSSRRWCKFSGDLSGEDHEWISRRALLNFARKQNDVKFLDVLTKA